MNARDTAINLCNWMVVGAEPAGASGAFWRIMGPRRKQRGTAGGASASGSKTPSTGNGPAAPTAAAGYATTTAALTAPRSERTT